MREQTDPENPGSIFPEWDAGNEHLRKALNSLARLRDFHNARNDALGLGGYTAPVDKSPTCGDCSVPMRLNRRSRFQCDKCGFTQPNPNKPPKPPKKPKSDPNQADLFEGQ